MITQYDQLIDALAVTRPWGIPRRRSRIKKLVLAVIVKAPFLSTQKRFRLHRSLVKAQIADLSVGLHRLRKAELALGPVDPAPQSVLETDVGITASAVGSTPPAGTSRLVHKNGPDQFVAASDKTGAISAVELRQLDELGNNVTPPRVISFAFTHHEMAEAQSRYDWLAAHEVSVAADILAKLDGYDTLSLDVFDTFILRGQESEAERYLDWSRYVLEHLKDSPYYQVAQVVSPEGLTLLRAEAMELTYRFRTRVQGFGEGSIQEVARTISNRLGQEANFAQKLLELEISFECTRLARNPVISRLVSGFRNEGGRVILVSDMYLHGDMIEKICRSVDPEGMGHVEKIISSADTILSKRSGSIFKLLEDKLALDPERTLHIGDSFHSDVMMARKSGWHAIHFPVSRPEIVARHQSVVSTIKHFDSQGIDIRSWAKP